MGYAGERKQKVRKKSVKYETGGQIVEVNIKRNY